MYLPKHFEMADRTALQALVSDYPLGTWIVQCDGELVINHIPFFLDSSAGANGMLIGHVARANPVWRQLACATSSVVVFQGPQAYVSPRWYAGKLIDGKVVPTWNYAVAHAHGTPRAIEDRQRLLEMVSQMSALQEAPLDQPWAVSDAPAEFIEGMLGAIIGVEIPLDRLTGKWKCSQNRRAQDQRRIAAGLQENVLPHAQEMGRAMAHGLAPESAHGLALQTQRDSD